jgi:hypothetical protein
MPKKLQQRHMYDKGGGGGELNLFIIEALHLNNFLDILFIGVNKCHKYRNPNRIRTKIVQINNIVSAAEISAIATLRVCMDWTS